MKCKFIKADSSNCLANATKDSDYCFMHDPKKEEERMIAVKAGGMAPKRFLLKNNEKIVIEDARDAKIFLSRVINGVWNGEIPATPVANTLGFLVRCLLDAYEKSEIEFRLDEIERKLEEVKND